MQSHSKSNKEKHEWLRIGVISEGITFLNSYKTKVTR
jgi:hypothetical protein